MKRETVAEVAEVSGKDTTVSLHSPPSETT
jgi:hypothetical protein